MPFLDELGGILSRAGEDLSKAGRANQLKQQLNELTGRRQVLMLQLGESLFAQLQESDNVAEDFKETFSGILAIDEERQSVEAELNELTPAAPEARICPNCGAPYSAGDSFCEKCGSELES